MSHIKNVYERVCGFGVKIYPHTHQGNRGQRVS